MSNKNAPPAMPSDWKPHNTKGGMFGLLPPETNVMRIARILAGLPLPWETELTPPTSSTVN